MKHILYTAAVALAALALPVVTGLHAQNPGTDPPVKNHPEVQITSLQLNSSDDDFASAGAKGGEYLIFTSDRRGGQKLYASTRTASGWTAPEPVSDALENASHTGSAALTPDGNFMIFAAYQWDEQNDMQKGSGRTDLYSATKQGGQWTNIVNLGSMVNSPGWDTHPSLSSDGRTLYFASDRPGGLGGSDIYVSRMTASGWSSPVNLGAVVNTAGNEMSPSIAPDGRRLFFSSNGHGGAGGYDLFVAGGGNAAGTGWKDVENLGTPINSASDEYFFTSIPNSKNSYFSSNRNGDFDIYLAYPNPYPPEALITVGGTVMDAESRKPLGARITVTDLGSGEVVASFNSDSLNGEYFVILNRGSRYSITAEAPDHMFYSDEYSIPPSTEGRDVRKDILLKPVGGKTRLLVFFDFDKDVLKDESKPDLERAVEFLLKNTGIRVEIAGHTDNVGPPGYNLDLSNRRAAAVKQYMVRRGIESGRIESKGYGETQPITENSTEDGRAQNRRVEMVVK